MKACIAVADYYVPGQTFVNRHIERLFDGNTCVVAGRINDLRPVDERFFQRRGELTLLDRVTGPFILPYNHLTVGTSRLPFGSAKKRLRAFLRRECPDFCLCEFGTQAIPVAPAMAAEGIPVFTYFRGSDASSRLNYPGSVKAYRRTFPLLDGIFSVSHSLLKNLEEVGLTHENAMVIPSGVDVRRFRPAEKDPGSCLTVGRFVEKKSPLLHVRAFAKASEGVPEAHLTMIGDGELLESAKALAVELGVAEKVSFPGALPHDEVREHMARSQYFLQHSVTARNGNTEGLPTAIQEALASGCLIVSTRHAGIPDAVADGRTGFLVEEHDETGFTERLYHCLHMGAERQAEMARNARQEAVDRFDNEMLLHRLEDAIRDSLEAKGRVPRAG